MYRILPYSALKILRAPGLVNALALRGTMPLRPFQLQQETTFDGCIDCFSRRSPLFVYNKQHLIILR